MKIVDSPKSELSASDEVWVSTADQDSVEEHLGSLKEFFVDEFEPYLTELSSSISSRESYRRSALSQIENLHELREVASDLTSIELPVVSLSTFEEGMAMEDLEQNTIIELATTLERKKTDLTAKLEAEMRLRGSVEIAKKILADEKLPPREQLQDLLPQSDGSTMIYRIFEELELLEADLRAMNETTYITRKELSRIEVAEEYSQAYSDLKKFQEEHPEVALKPNHGKTIYVTDLLYKLEDQIVEHITSIQDPIDSENSLKALEMGILLSKESLRLLPPAIQSEYFHPMLERARLRVGYEQKGIQIVNSRPPTKML